MSCCNGNSILNGTGSLIGSPVCTPACPPSGYGCADIIFTDCVTYTGPTLACVSGNTGDSATTLFYNINTAICNSSDDITIINNEIINITNDITNITNNITNISGEISSCIEWNTVGPSGGIASGNFSSNSYNYGDLGPYPTESAAYSNLKNCRVYLKGFVSVGIAEGPTGIFPIFTLPIGLRPANLRVFPATFLVNGTLGGGATDGNILAGFIYIFDTGVVALGWNGQCCGNVIIDFATIMSTSLENISFDI